MNSVVQRGCCALLTSLVVLASDAYASDGTADDPIIVGSKNFNESYILGELVSSLLEHDGYVVDRRFGLGGTKICYDALVKDEIDVYVEYTGTVSQSILEQQSDLPIPEINSLLAERGIEMLDELGFNNTYAIAVRRAVAEERGLSKLSQISKHSDLRVFVSHEFIERADGWPALQQVYEVDWLPQGIEHALAYRAMSEGTIDVTDAYSTDAELVFHDLVVLEDDRAMFPRYLAAPLLRSDLDDAIKSTINRMAGRIDDELMSSMNSEVVYGEKSFGEVSAKFLHSIGIRVRIVEDQRGTELVRNTLRHLELTGIALLSATIIALLISLAVYRIVWLARTVVYVAGLLQTIPSIALLALMIPLFGIGMVPAIMALFLYSLLPIIRNCVTALSTSDPMLIRVAEGMGLSGFERLRYVLVPLAMPSIIAGIRTSAVICIGTATLAAFIGAGGLGDPIVTGLALNDTGLILFGAIPAALLAIVTELVFEAIERFLVPGHLKVLGPASTQP